MSPNLKLLIFVLFVLAQFSIAFADTQKKEKVIQLPVDEKVQIFKSDIIKLGHDLALLEGGISPIPGSNLIIYLSLDIEEGFTLKSVELVLNGDLVLEKIFNFKTLRAIRNGGILRLYNKNIPSGNYEIKVRLEGKLGKNKNHKNSATFQFNKTTSAKTIELRITNIRERFLPEFAVREWN